MITTRIFKYSFEGNDTIEIPRGGKILHMEVIGEVPRVWALVDTAKTITDTYKIFGTGQQIGNLDKLEYMKTFLLYEGKLVFHMFRVKQ